MAGEDFDWVQWDACLKGRRPRSRMALVHRGDLSEPTIAKAVRLVESGDAWGPPKASSRTWGNSGVVWCMAASSMCGFEQLIFRFWRTCPYSLFRLAEEPTRGIAEDLADRALLPERMQASWTRRFPEVQDS